MEYALVKSSFWLLCGKLTIGGKRGNKVTSQEAITLCRQDVVEAWTREVAVHWGIR